MTAYNEVVALARCPACNATCELRFQMHAWASYDGDVAEQCYGACTCCQAELLATVVFRDLRPVQITDVTVDDGQPPSASGLT